MPENNFSPIRSTLASDPDYLDLVQEFVSEMPAKQAAIKVFAAKGDLPQLQRAIHQLRGACGGYGFQCLTTAAASIEESIKAGNSLQAIEARLNEFIADLSRITADPE
jgi:HPt (histidine-containing phosphotransfer) domain-containing protein